MIDVEVSIADRRWRVPSHRLITALVQRTMRVVRRSRTRGTLSLAFIGDAAMRRFNRTLRGKNRTTDVLSFVYSSTKEEIRGEILISLPTARRQAVAIGSSLHNEVLFLIVHGLLHIVGYDHERSKREERQMNALQRRILRRPSSQI